MRRSRIGLAVAVGYLTLGMAVPPDSRSERKIDLAEAVRLAKANNPNFAIAAARKDVARAGTVIAGQFPNPEFGGSGGPFFAREKGVSDGSTVKLHFAQPLEYPFVRSARQEEAEANLAAAQASARALEAQLVADVRFKFSDLVLRAEQLEEAQKNEESLKRARDLTRRKVELGEAPGLDFTRAETGLLNARRVRLAAVVSVTSAKLDLARIIGMMPNEQFSVVGTLPSNMELPPRTTLRQRMIEQNPELTQARDEVQRSRKRLTLERGLRIPPPTFQAEWEREPDNEKVFFGARLPLPLWNRRGGQIAEALARIREAEATLKSRELTLELRLNSAHGRYLSAQAQLTAIQGGLIEQARKALAGAEVAYQSGARGILDYLLAQRTFNSVRLDLLKARSDLQRTVIEIELLLGSVTVEPAP